MREIVGSRALRWALVGMVIGFLYHRLGAACGSTWGIGANPYTATLLGGAFGWLLACGAGATDWRERMGTMDWLAMLGILALWILVQRVILPAMGVPTWMAPDACAVEPREKEPRHPEPDGTNEQT